jgi:hypothetical protein
MIRPPAECVKNTHACDYPFWHICMARTELSEFLYYRLLDGLQELGRFRYPFRNNLLPKTSRKQVIALKIRYCKKM